MMEQSKRRPSDGCGSRRDLLFPATFVTRVAGRTVLDRVGLGLGVFRVLAGREAVGAGRGRL